MTYLNQSNIFHSIPVSLERDRERERGHQINANMRNNSNIQKILFTIYRNNSHFIKNELILIKMIMNLIELEVFQKSK